MAARGARATAVPCLLQALAKSRRRSINELVYIGQFCGVSFSERIENGNLGARKFNNRCEPYTSSFAILGPRLGPKPPCQKSQVCRSLIERRIVARQKPPVTQHLLWVTAPTRSGRGRFMCGVSRSALWYARRMPLFIRRNVWVANS